MRMQVKHYLLPFFVVIYCDWFNTF
jgi:hypothetical protein